jgi:hypothetical protein
MYQHTGVAPFHCPVCLKKIPSKKVLTLWTAKSVVECTHCHSHLQADPVPTTTLTAWLFPFMFAIGFFSVYMGRICGLSLPLHIFYAILLVSGSLLLYFYIGRKLIRFVVADREAEFLEMITKSQPRQGFLFEAQKVLKDRIIAMYSHLKKQ